MRSIFTSLLLAALMLPGVARTEDLPSFRQVLDAAIRHSSSSAHADPTSPSLEAGFQKLEAHPTQHGLQVRSSAPGEEGMLALSAQALSRGESAHATRLAPLGQVTPQGHVVAYTRPMLTEEYSASVDGVRQDFIVTERLPGSGALWVNLALTGAKATPGHGGVKLTLDQSGRELFYGKLHVTDAKGITLVAGLEVLAEDQLAIHVDDASAVYPLRIDPTFSDADWFAVNTGLPGADATVYASTIAPNGRIYIGGSFKLVTDVKASGIAYWDGTSWNSIGGGVEGTVYCMYLSGTDLYVGGDFTKAGGASIRSFAKVNTSSGVWSTVGASGVSGGLLTVYGVAGAGSDVYIGGWFTGVGGVSGTNNVARWNGSAWSALSSGTNNTVRAVEYYRSKFVFGGEFTTAGLVANTSGIAQWDGAAWSSLGTGLTGTVYALGANTTPTIPVLYVGGVISSVGQSNGTPLSVTNLAKYDGASWSNIGAADSIVFSIEAAGSGVIAGGNFGVIGGNNIPYAAYYNGSNTWSSLGSGGPGGPVRTVSYFSSSLAFLGGEFINRIGGDLVRNMLSYNSSTSTFTAYGSGVDERVNAVAVKGTDLYIGGRFRRVGTINARYIARWNGSTWSALGSGMNNEVHDLHFIGNDLYAGGGFTLAGGNAVQSVAKWNGTAWSAVGSGVSGIVYGLTSIGSTLYAGGSLSSGNVASWNGSAWSSLGSGVDSIVFDLAADGTNLYVAGAFSNAGGAPASRVAMWNGSQWSSLGSGVSGSVGGYVYALAYGGGNLYAGGDIEVAGGTSGMGCVAKWNGSAWSRVGPSGANIFGSSTNSFIRAIAVSGTNVYVGGDFQSLNGSATGRMAMFDGTSWSAVGSGVSGPGNYGVYALAADDNGSLFVGGDFTFAGTTASPFIARGLIQAATTPPTFTSPPSLSHFRNSVPVAFSLPQAARAGTVKLTFTGAVTRELILASSEEAAGSHSFTLSPANPTASPNVASGSAIPDGVYQVALSYQNFGGSSPASVTASTITLDNVAPTFSQPANLRVQATGPSGAIVTYSASASDAGSGLNTQSYLPASGSLFPLGTTTVQATAQDLAGNTATSSFTITVVEALTPSWNSVDDRPFTFSGFNAGENFLGTPTINFAARSGDALYLVDNTSANPIAGIFPNYPEGSLLPYTMGGDTVYFQLSYVGGDGNDITLTRVPGVGQSASLAWETFAGLDFQSGDSDGPSDSALLYYPTAITVAPNGTVYLADNKKIKRITRDRVVTTLASTSLGYFEGIAADAAGNVYYSNFTRCTIHKINPGGTVSTLAGSDGVFGAQNGQGTQATFSQPARIYSDNAGNLLVVDNGNFRVRQITSLGVVSDFYSLSFNNSLWAITKDAGGNTYIADQTRNNILKLTPGLSLSTFAGSPFGFYGLADGPSTDARFNSPLGIAVGPGGNFYVSDAANGKIRKITPAGLVSTEPVDFSGRDISASRNGVLYVADGPGARVLRGALACRPILTLGTPVSINATATTLHGSVNPNGFVTSAKFQYGPTAALGAEAPVDLASPSGLTSQNVSVDLSGLGLATTYYYRLTATNLDGTSTTATGTFSTPDSQAPQFIYLPEDVTVTAPTLAPIAVEYNLALASDNSGETPTITYSHLSGSSFPVGITEVTVTAKDAAGNETSATFNVTVLGGPSLQLEYPPGISQSSGATLDFGVLAPKTPLEAVVRLTNGGDVALTGLYASITGPDAALFSVVSAPANSLAGGAAVLISIRANLSGTGVKRAELHLASNDATQPDYVLKLAAEVGATSLPSVITLPATQVTVNSATLNATVNARGIERTVEFAVMGNALGLVTPSIPGAVSGTADTAVSWTVGGLLPHTTYTFQPVVSSPAGIKPGAPKTFTTANSLPTAVNDSLVIVQPTTTLNVLANDTDPDGDAATFSVAAIASPLTPATAGKLKVSKGAVTFTKSATFTTASFSYRMQDGFGGTSIATVTLTSGTASITPPTHEIESAGGTYPLTINSAGTWNAVADSWISVNPAKGEAGETLVSVSVAPNAKKTARTGTIRIGTASHTLTQSGVDAIPSLGPVSPTPYQGSVGGFFSLLIPTENGPVTYTARNLPPGLKINHVTGILSGIPKKAGTFDVSLTARNAEGTSAPLEFTIEIAPLSKQLSGPFLGFMARNDVLNRGLGARVEFTISPGGALSGKVVIATTATSFKSILYFNDDLTTAQFSAVVPKLGTLEVNLDAVTGEASGTFTDLLGSSTAAVELWSVPWGEVSTGLANYSGLYSFYLQQSDESVALPQGFGFGSFAVGTKAGALKVTGQLPDGSALSTAGFLGAQGEVLLYAPLYKNAGSLVGKLVITPGATVPVQNTLLGTPTWTKPPTRDLLYPAGFTALPLDTLGGFYQVPAAGEIILGLPVPTGVDPSPNAELTISPSRSDILTSDFSTAVLISPVGRADSKAVAEVTANGVLFTKLSASTGTFKGTFVLPDAAAALTRKPSFAGQLVPVGGNLYGYGYFLAPKLTADTLAGSPTLSGSILLRPAQ